MPKLAVLLPIFFLFHLFSLVMSQCPQVVETNACHYIIGTKKVPLSSDCSIATCNNEPVINMTDNVRGKVAFTLPALSPTCNVTRYEIALRVRPSATDCASPDAEWKTHSRRSVHVTYCRPEDVACTTKSPQCSKSHVVNFGYVYSGWYQLKITPHLGSSTRQAQRSKPVHLLTGYVPQGLVDLNSTVSSLQYRDDNSESRVSFLFSPDLDWGEPDRFHVTLRLVSRVDSQQDAPCYASGKEHSCCAFHSDARNGTAVECTSYTPGGQPNCSATRNSVQCRFRDMQPGAYCAILSFLDDRCEPDTVWTEPDNRPCQWQTYKEFHAEHLIETSTTVKTSSGIVYIALGVVFGVALVIAALVFALRHRSKRRQRVPTHITAEGQQHRFGMERLGSRHFSFSNQFTLTDRPRPEVLLVYCRDSKPFVELVHALRNVLNKICKCQVYDYFDEAQWNHVSADPEGWVRELILEREAKVIIVASRAAAISNRADAVKYRNPHAFDHIFPYILKLLRDSANDDSYRHHFVVCFDGYTDNNHLVEHLNPYTRFVLPKHLNKLFEHLHDSNTTVHFDTSHKLEEREEVRQLRLRLEHLINLNLTKNAQDQIYDW